MQVLAALQIVDIHDIYLLYSDRMHAIAEIHHE